MTKTVVYVPAPETAAGCVAWAPRLADIAASIEGREAFPVEYLCTSPHGGLATIDAVQAALGDDRAPIQALPALDPMVAAMSRAREAATDIFLSSVAALPLAQAVDTARRILKTTPCATLVVLSGERRPADVRRVLAILSDSANDEDVFKVAQDLASGAGGHLTLARIEEDVGSAATVVGERELARFLRERGVEDLDAIEQKVVVDNYPVRGALACFDDHDVVLVSASSLDMVKSLGAALGDAVVGVVKRQPPLKRRALPDWIPQVNPADYAELAETLRHGSRWGPDFVVMLGLASGIATLGLIQDSAAVVIGSMLLAPLMTPMLGSGLSLAQANSRMARSSGKTILLGFLLTLTISFVLGHLSFRETLSPQILARGEPNILDLGIALLAAMAASYALARPSLSGAIAGVAIATALVPPVCACGVSLANGYWMNALGAGVLFATNLLAIILASALSFMGMGVTIPHNFSRARRRARHILGGLATGLFLLCLPLGWVLAHQIAEGRNQPLAFPVTRAVTRALEAHVAQAEGVRIMVLGRVSKSGEVVVFLASDQDLSSEYRETLRAIVREQMDDPEVVVTVIVVQSAMGG